jgi:hypothetical protein
MSDQAFVVSEVESTQAGGCCLVPNFHLSHPLLLSDSCGDGVNFGCALELFQEQFRNLVDFVIREWDIAFKK